MVLLLVRNWTAYRPKFSRQNVIVETLHEQPSLTADQPDNFGAEEGETDFVCPYGCTHTYTLIHDRTRCVYKKMKMESGNMYTRSSDVYLVTL